jgi:hypothetical protein
MNRPELNNDSPTPSKHSSITLDISVVTNALDCSTRPHQRRGRQFSRDAEPDTLDRAMDRLVERLLPNFQRYLDSLEGRDFGKDGNLQLARSITRLLRRLDCCLTCTKCGESAYAIRYVDKCRPGRWIWRFEHTPSRRHGGTVAIPHLILALKSRVDNFE